MVGSLLQTVHAEIPARDRKKVYDKIKDSNDSILFQYSVVKEGIDITPFNALIISRNLDVIGTQQGIGRVVRAHPEDTAALKAGTISLDSPEGWKKYTATVYVIIHDGEMDDYRKRLKDFIGKLQFTGLTDEDYQFGEIVEQRSGMSEENDASVPILSTRELFEQDSLRDMIARLRIEMEEDELLAAAELKVGKMSDEQVLESCLTF
jgi:superfamily II DNA or RNA helicase